MRSIHRVTIVMMLLGIVSVTFGKANQVGVNVGGTSIYNKNTIKLDNFSAGLYYQFNDINFGLKPRVDIDYVSISDYKDVASLYKASLNGVYEFSDENIFSPYMMFGLGYEYVNGSITKEFDSHLFTQGGLGIRYNYEDRFNLNLEAKALQILGGKNQDNEIIIMAGISIPIGKTSKVVKTTNNCPKKTNAPDEDRDGIADVIDQCPLTPCYFTVDMYGCPIKATLRVHFDVNRAIIRDYSLPKVERFATFLKGNRGTTVKIIGHTDSDAADAYNMILSEKRANAVLNKLVELGVSRNRLSAEGKGERMPIASNETKRGKSLNRRIEVELTYPRR